MHCEDIHTLLPDFSREVLSPAAQQLVQKHVTECRSCSAIVQREQQLQASLRALPVSEMPAGFAARAMHQAREQNRLAGRFVSVRRLAVAASFLLVCGLAFMLGRGLPLAAQDAPVQLALGQTRMVALKIDAPQAFGDVQFEVTLPQNVALENQPELREFAWSGQLQAGVNVLSLPLTGVVPTDGKLVATVSYGKTKRSLNVPLLVAAKQKG